MYNPARFKSENVDEAFKLMEAFPFATLISVTDSKPIISQVPLTAVIEDGKITLIGHFARANPHCDILSNGDVTVVFHGPHAYITPKWYTENDVPTWNYLTVHASGSVEVLSTYQDLVECLRALSKHAEKYWPSGWDFFIPIDLSDNTLMQSILGFKIHVNELSFKKKLSQNRSQEDREGVIRGLSSRVDDNSRAILEEMKIMKGTK